MQIAPTLTLSFSDVRRQALATRLTDAAARLDKVVAIITPDANDPKKPALSWGDDLGVFEHLNKAANVLDQGYDGLTEIYTRRQAGKLFDALEADVAHVQALRDAALAIEEGKKLGPIAPAPTLGSDAVKLLSRAAQDARAAVLLLTPKA